MDSNTMINLIKDLLLNLAGSSTITIYQCGALASLISLDPKYIVFTILTFIFGDGFNFIAKKYSRYLCGNLPVCNRPITLDNGSISDCSVFQRHHYLNNLDKFKTHSFGMPSGHSQIAALTATFWTLYQVGHLKVETDSNKRTSLIISMVVIWLLAILVMYQRLHTRCHNLEQVIIGGCLGVLLGFLAYIVATNIPGLDIPDINNILFNNNVEDDDEDNETDDEIHSEDNEEDTESNQGDNVLNNNVLNNNVLNNKDLVLDLQKYENDRKQQDIQNIQSNNFSLDSNELVI